MLYIQSWAAIKMFTLAIYPSIQTRTECLLCAGHYIRTHKTWVCNQIQVDPQVPILPAG